MLQSINFLPKTLQDLIDRVGQPVSPDQLDMIGKYQKISDDSYKIRTVTEAWKEQHGDERIMRKNFATAILAALAIQILVINTAFFFLGFGLIKVDQWVANTFIISVFTEIVAMTTLVLNYLFPKYKTDIIELIKNI